ncbi:MAG TPA: HEAT repeat domain-containing protein [Candidatus Limnocylindrales bacterium]
MTHSDLASATARLEHQLGSDVDDISGLIEDLGQPDHRVREDAGERLVQMGRHAVGPLVAALRDPCWEVRAGAVTALGRIGDTAATTPLLEALGDPLVGPKAAQALGLLGDRQAVEPLKSLLSDPLARMREAAREGLDALALRFPLDESLRRPEGTPLSHRTALNRIVAQGIESVLLPAGFNAVGKRLWVRRERELLHLVALGFRHGTYGIEFGIVSPEATDFLWGHPAKPSDFGDVVMHGTPGHIRWPAACENFAVGEQEDSLKIDEMAGLVAQDMDMVASWLAQFRTRRDYRDWLVEGPDANDGGGRFFIPSPALRVYIAAVLAVLDRDSKAGDLVDQAEIAMRPWNDRLNRERIGSLKAALAEMGGAGATGS